MSLAEKFEQRLKQNAGNTPPATLAAFASSLNTDLNALGLRVTYTGTAHRQIFNVTPYINDKRDTRELTLSFARAGEERMALRTERNGVAHEYLDLDSGQKKTLITAIKQWLDDLPAPDTKTTSAEPVPALN